MKKTKMPYIAISIVGNDKIEYWPYEEAREYCLNKISKEDIVWLTDEEVIKLNEGE